MIRLPLSIIFALGACGRLHPAAPVSSSPAHPLTSLYQKNLATYNDATAATSGWPSATDCDGTVWAGTAYLGGADANMSLAEWAPGEIHRRPKASGECFPVESSSTVSRDDLILYMGAAVAAKDAGALQRLQAYAQANSDWMGQPHDPNYTLMTPTLVAILSRAISGGSSGIDIEAPGAKDYQDHIEVEEILLSTTVNGGANGWELALLESLEAQFPNDALFQAAKGIYSGDCDVAAKLLLQSPTSVPTYVRGDQVALFAQAWWLRAAKLVLEHCQ